MYLRHISKKSITNIIIMCLTKVGQNIFVDETEPFSGWLESLYENALYKASDL